MATDLKAPLQPSHPAVQGDDSGDKERQDSDSSSNSGLSSLLSSFFEFFVPALFIGLSAVWFISTRIAELVVHSNKDSPTKEEHFTFIALVAINIISIPLGWIILVFHKLIDWLKRLIRRKAIALGLAMLDWLERLIRNSSQEVPAGLIDELAQLKDSLSNPDLSKTNEGLKYQSGGITV